MRIDEKELVIRVPEKADAASILEYLRVVGGESDHLSFGKEGHPNTIEQEEAYLEGLATAKNKIMLIVVYKGEIIADGSLGGPLRERMRHTMELGISVKKAFWGQGIGTRVLNILFEEALKIPYVTQISLEVKEDNARAISVYEKLGFIASGRHVRKMKVNDKYYDTIIMTKFLR